MRELKIFVYAGDSRKFQRFYDRLSNPATLLTEYDEEGLNIFQICDQCSNKKFLEILNSKVPSQSLSAASKKNVEKFSREEESLKRNFLDGQSLRATRSIDSRYQLRMISHVMSLKELATNISRVHPSGAKFKKVFKEMYKHLTILCAYVTYLRENQKSLPSGLNWVQFSQSHHFFNLKQVEPTRYESNCARLVQSVIMGEFDIMMSLFSEELRGAPSNVMPIFSRTIILQPEIRIVDNMMSILSQITTYESENIFLCAAIFLAALNKCAPQGFAENLKISGVSIMKIFSHVHLMFENISRPENQNIVQSYLKNEKIEFEGKVFPFPLICQVIKQEFTSLRNFQNIYDPLLSQKTCEKRGRSASFVLDEHFVGKKAKTSQEVVVKLEELSDSFGKLSTQVWQSSDCLRSNIIYHLTKFHSHYDQNELPINPQTLFFSKAHVALYHLIILSGLLTRNKEVDQLELPLEQSSFHEFHQGIFRAHRHLQAYNRNAEVVGNLIERCYEQAGSFIESINACEKKMCVF